MTREKQDAVGFVQQHSGMIASSLQPGFRLSPMGFGRDTSNLNATSVKELMRAFQIKDGWRQLNAVSSRVGIGAPSLEQSFTNAARSRHSAAHDPKANTTLGTLATIAQDALAIAVALDLILSRALAMLVSGDADYCRDDFALVHTDVRIRFLDERVGGKWASIPEGGSRAWRIATQYDQLLQASRTAAAARGENLVSRNLRLQPFAWEA